MNGPCGILCIDKPEGFTSFDVVAKMRGIAHTRRIGHAGTLDPMATGVLPLFFGQATKAVDLIPEQDKSYTAWFQLGIETDTCDITGQVTRQAPVSVGLEQVLQVAGTFLGEVRQTPPMYSAVQVQGKRLYELARKGLEVERPSRLVRISRLEVAACEEKSHTYQMRVDCSKGTYIRSLVQDIGRALGCGAVLTKLRRTKAAGWTLEDCVRLETAQQAADEGNFEQLLQPVESVFAGLPRAKLSEKQVRLFQNGVRLDLSRVDSPKEGRVAVYGPEGTFLAVADAMEGELRMKKQFLLGE